MSLKYLSREALSSEMTTLFETFGEMTVRQVYYQLVSKHLIPNTKQAYKAFDATLTRCREDASVDEDLIIDGSRPLDNFYWRGYRDIADFTEYFGKHYERDPLQGQPYQIELWCEKDALRRFIADSVTYADLIDPNLVGTLPLPNCAIRGYSPYTILKDTRKRADDNAVVILYFGDFDPSGEDIYRNVSAKAQAHHVERVALSRDQVDEHDLPTSPTKPTDSRTPGFLARHGRDETVELDALPPNILRGLVQDAIREWLDPEAVKRTLAASDSERALIKQRLNAV